MWTTGDKDGIVQDIGVILHSMIEGRGTMHIPLTGGGAHSHPIEEMKQGMRRGH